MSVSVNWGEGVQTTSKKSVVIYEQPLMTTSEKKNYFAGQYLWASDKLVFFVPGWGTPLGAE